MTFLSGIGARLIEKTPLKSWAKVMFRATCQQVAMRKDAPAARTTEGPVTEVTGPSERREGELVLLDDCRRQVLARG